MQKNFNHSNWKIDLHARPCGCVHLILSRPGYIMFLMHGNNLCFFIICIIVIIIIIINNNNNNNNDNNTITLLLNIIISINIIYVVVVVLMSKTHFCVILSNNKTIYLFFDCFSLLTRMNGLTRFRLSPIQRYTCQGNGWAESAGTQYPVELVSPELLLPYRQHHAIDKHGLCQQHNNHGFILPC